MKTTSVLLNLPQDFIDKIDIIAQVYGKSRTAMLRDTIITERVENNKDKIEFMKNDLLKRLETI